MARWFTDSPDVGTPECLCSFCEQPIPEDDEAGPILRAWHQARNLELRACHRDECEGKFWRATAGEAV